MFFLLIVAITGGVWALMLRPAPPLPPPSDQADACSIRDERPGWYRATRAAARKWDVPPSTMLAIIWRESNFRAQARPPRRKGWWIFEGAPISTAYGFSQALDGTWAWYVEDTGAEGARRDRYADAVDFIGWYMDKSREKLGFSGIDAQAHYLAYHQGHGGYRKGRWRQIAWLRRAAAAVQTRAIAYDEQLFDCDTLHAHERTLQAAPVPRAHPWKQWEGPIPSRKPDPVPELAALKDGGD